MCQLTEVFAKARLLEASKWWSHVGLIVSVDEDSSSLQPLAHIHGLVDVAGEHAWGQAVLCVVGSLQHSFHIAVVWSNKTKDMGLATQTNNAMEMTLLCWWLTHHWIWTPPWRGRRTPLWQWTCGPPHQWTQWAPWRSLEDRCCIDY